MKEFLTLKYMQLSLYKTETVGNLRPERTLSRQSRKIQIKIYKRQRPGYRKTTQETAQRFKPLKTRQGLIYLEKNDPENPRTSTLTTLDGGRKSKGNTDAIFKNEVRSFLFTQTQPTKPQKNTMDKVKLDNQPPKDATSNQTDTVNDQNKGLPNLETVEAKHISDAEQQSQEETTEAPNSETPLELAISDDDISISSAAEATLDTDSQLDSQNDEGADINPRKARRCNRLTPGSYATMHVGRPKAQKKEKNGKGKKPNNQTSQREIIMYLENENKELKDKIMEIEMEQQTGTTDQNNNQTKINELEAEIECLMGQIHENDSYVEQLEQTHIQVTNLTLKLNQAQATENQLQTEIDNLKISIEELKEMNAKLKSENRSLKEKNKEANKHAKKMEQSAQKLAGEKTTLEQVAQEKNERIVELETNITRLENQNETSMEEEQAPAKPTAILGDSNCRDVQAHLMMWLNRDIRHEWAPTLQAAKERVQSNKEDLDGTTIILLPGTNNIKNYDPHHVVSQMHSEVTQAITDAGATLIIIQLPPVYSP